MTSRKDKFIIVNGPFRGAICTVKYIGAGIAIVNFIERQKIKSLQVKVINKDVFRKRRFFYAERIQRFVVHGRVVVIAGSRHERVRGATMPSRWLKALKSYVSEEWSKERI